MAVAASGSIAVAEDAGDPAAVKSENGKYLDKEGNPTFKVGADGTVDWFTYSGYRRYHSECHVCHGPDGDGFDLRAGAEGFTQDHELCRLPRGGRHRPQERQHHRRKTSCPAFGDNPNVVCYLDDIYVYLRARANDAVGRGRPAKHEDKPPAAQKAEDTCMGSK